MTRNATKRIADASAENKRLEQELDQLHDQIDAVREDRDDFEAKWESALDELDRLKDKHEAEGARSFRPDVRRMDRGDWTHASCNQFCDACGFQYWEHPTVPGYEWMRRICDGRLVKL